MKVPFRSLGRGAPEDDRGTDEDRAGEAEAAQEGGEAHEGGAEGHPGEGQRQAEAVILVRGRRGKMSFPAGLFLCVS